MISRSVLTLVSNQPAFLGINVLVCAFQPAWSALVICWHVLLSFPLVSPFNPTLQVYRQILCPAITLSREPVYKESSGEWLVLSTKASAPPAQFPTVLLDRERRPSPAGKYTRE
jgi:hypothetical protein